MLTIEQKELRKTGIGGSDVAAICGLNPYKSPNQVYLEKIGLEDNSYENRYMYWGNQLEPILANEYEKISGKKLNIVDTKRSDKYSFMIANIDRLIDDGGIWEGKTTDSRNSKKWGKEGTNQIPITYLLQCIHYAIVYDAPYVDISVLIGGNDYRIYRYDRIKDWEDKILTIEENFWKNHVLKSFPPEFYINNETKKIINDISSSIDNKIDNYITSNDELENSINYIKRSQEIIDKLEEKIYLRKEKIRNFIGDNDYILDKEGKKICSYLNINRNTFDISLFKEKNPNLYKEFTKNKNSRSLRIY